MKCAKLGLIKRDYKTGKQNTFFSFPLLLISHISVCSLIKLVKIMQ